MRKLLPYLIIFSAATILAGCGGGRTASNDPYADIEVVEGTIGEDATATGLGDDEDLSNLSDDDLLAQRVIYFAYDSSLLNAEGDAVIKSHAQYLNSNPGTQVILEGHADERGTREYNLALAEGRAKSAANLMEALGISSSRIQVVSYGEERPVALGHDEKAWSLNRRVEILYQ